MHYAVLCTTPTLAGGKTVDALVQALHEVCGYLLSGLMRCGCCGANFTKYGASRFGCAASRDRGTCENKLTIRGDELEASILSGLQSRLMEPARLYASAEYRLADSAIVMERAHECTQRRHQCGCA